jgi:hypothetical protein
MSRLSPSVSAVREEWMASCGLGVLSVQELVSEKDQPPVRTSRRAFEPQLDFVPAPAFAAAFERSDIFCSMRAALDAPVDKTKAHPGALMTSTYGAPGWDSLRALFKVKVNGFGKDPKVFARVMGYCEQFDVHSSGTTVREAIETSAILRLSKGVSAEQERFVLRLRMQFARCSNNFAAGASVPPDAHTHYSHQEHYASPLASVQTNRRQAVQRAEFVEECLRIVELDVIQARSSACRASLACRVSSSSG